MTVQTAGSVVPSIATNAWVPLERQAEELLVAEVPDTPQLALARPRVDARVHLAVDRVEDVGREVALLHDRAGRRVDTDVLQEHEVLVRAGDASHGCVTALDDDRARETPVDLGVGVHVPVRGGAERNPP